MLPSRSCPQCDAQIEPDASFCPQCGSWLSSMGATTRLRSPIRTDRFRPELILLACGGLILTLLLVLHNWPTAIPRVSEPIATGHQYVPVACNQAISDEFDQTIDERWYWIDPRDDATMSTQAQPGFLRISAPTGNDLFPGNNYDAPRLLQPISGNFAVETLIQFEPHWGYQGAGILIWQDYSNFVRLERSAGGIGGGTSGVRLDKAEAGVYSTVTPNSGMPTRAPQVELRLQRVGNQLTAFWRVPDGTWQEVARTVMPLAGELQIGLDLIAQHDVPQTTADYNYFHVTCV